MKALWRKEDGVAALEFAIISTVLLLLLFGIIEFGKTYSEYQGFQAAAREGARAAAVGATPDEVVSRVNEAADPYVPSEAPGMSHTCTDDTVGDPVTVSWTQDFQISIPFMPNFETSREIQGTFRCE